jgi:uncharacterized protein (DUF1697 family)
MLIIERTPAGLAPTERSGNVVFDDSRPSAQLRTLIESAISEEFGFDARIVLRERAPLVSLAVDRAALRSPLQ